jgi:non-ribosomal peptide synthetase component F
VRPDAAALDNGAEVLTYTERMEQADDLASLLGDLGVGKGDRVGVRIRSGTIELHVAIAAVLVAGLDRCQHRADGDRSDLEPCPEPFDGVDEPLDASRVDAASGRGSRGRPPDRQR